MSLLNLMNAVAETEIPLGGGVVKALKPEEARLPQSADLPLRLLLPPGADGKAIESYQVVSPGTAVVVWRVVDLLLYQAVGQGDITEIWPSLIEYIDSYLRTFTALGVNALVGYEPQAMVFEYPPGSKALFHGVQVVVRIQETL